MASLTAASLGAQADHGTIIIAAPAEAVSPIPTLWRYDAPNREVSDLLFLRLADLGADLNTVNEHGFVPRLARSWRRLDSLTLAFDLDPRARWHDGQPVTARDVVFTLNRARDRRLDPQSSVLLRHLASVTADGERRAVVHFDRAYPEQLYDATYHVPLLPAHLLEQLPPESLGVSSFAASPVGDGPFKWKRRVPGELVELVANDSFFLGRPKLDRVIFLVATDHEARMNLLLSGEADAVDNILQFANSDRLAAKAEFRLIPVRTLSVGYLLFNQRDPADTSRPHPILSDTVVRRALTMALDRHRMVRAAFGGNGEVPSGPVSQMLWIHDRAAPPVPWDTAGARRLLASRGWLDHDHDGVLDKDGRPLVLALLTPVTSLPRQQMALQGQEQLRALGISLEVKILERAVIVPRLNAGDFDMFFGSANQDPTPSGLTQSWSCAGIGASNYAKYCDPKLDSLFERALAGDGDPGKIWEKALRLISNDAPAAFVYAPTYLYAVHRRFDHVSIRPESSWAELWKWSVRPEEQLARDKR